MTLNTTFKFCILHHFYDFCSCLVNCSSVIPSNRVVEKDQVNDDMCFS